MMEMKLVSETRIYQLMWLLAQESLTEFSYCESFVSHILYRVADKSLARPTSWCILYYGENVSFDASLVIYIKSTNIPPIMIINRTYENQNLLSL